MSDTPKTDPILALLPGGQSCDPQAVADDLRPEIARLERELEQERQDRKQADLDTIRALGERNDARKALLLAAEWGIDADGYSAEVAGAIRAWIIGGYKGDPPTVPEYYPKRKYEPVNPP